jgi:hypothetical protein
VNNPGITVCVPTIPPRQALYDRAILSIGEAARNMPSGVPVVVSMAIDIDREGAAATRQRALEQSDTKWVAFLDDDDEMDPWHLRDLWLNATRADYVWSRFRVGFPGGQCKDGPEPLGPGTFEQWNDAQPAQTTVTTLVRRELAMDVGGFAQPDGADSIDGQRAGEDWLFTLACRAAGGVFLHVPKVTWTWNHHGANTSGLPDRW